MMMTWTSSEERMLRKTIEAVSDRPLKDIPSPDELLTEGVHLSEVGMSTFIKKLLKKLPNGWSALEEYKDGTFEATYTNRAVNAGLLVRTEEGLFFSDKAKIYLAQRAGL